MILKEFIDRYLGWRGWAVLTYNSILENLFVVFYIALYQRAQPFEFFVDLILFILFSSFCTSYGYLINDYSDRKLDALHGKANTFAGDTAFKARAIVIGFLLISLAIGWRFSDRKGFIPLVAIWLLIATAYSLRPIRLKERGKIGLIFVVIAQRALPILIVFSAFRHYLWVDCTLITLYIFFRGLSSDINHQLEDYANDSSSDTMTYAVQAGIKKTTRLFKISLEIEKALLFLYLVIICLRLDSLRIYHISPVLPILVGYGLLFVINIIKNLTGRSEKQTNPFLAGNKNISQFIHHGFPSVAFPLYLLLIMIIINWHFLPVLIVFMLLKNLFSWSTIKAAYPTRFILRFISIGKI